MIQETFSKKLSFNDFWNFRLEKILAPPPHTHTHTHTRVAKKNLSFHNIFVVGNFFLIFPANFSHSKLPYNWKIWNKSKNFNFIFIDFEYFPAPENIFCAFFWFYKVSHSSPSVLIMCAEENFSIFWNTAKQLYLMLSVQTMLTTLQNILFSKFSFAQKIYSLVQLKKKTTSDLKKV